MKFTVQAQASSGVPGTWEASAEHFPALICAIPKEFQGSGDGYSPEDLFAISVMNCIIATYKVIAKMVNLTFDKITSDATVSIEVVNKKPTITSLHINFKVHQPSDPAKAEKIFEDTKRNCMVSNAISIEKTFTFSS